MEWLYRMSENLLTITRITDVEKSSLKLTEELLEEILSSAAAIFRKHQPGTALQVHVPENVMFVLADPLLIEQVLLNLLYNAVQHGRTATAIRVDVQAEEGFAEIAVTDNGCGISRELLAHLFDGTFESAGESADSTRGMGIGLTVCRVIVEAHGGRIWAENTGSGARFIFTLRRA